MSPADTVKLIDALIRHLEPEAMPNTGDDRQCMYDMAQAYYCEIITGIRELGYEITRPAEPR